jgi:hypothetical protein
MERSETDWLQFEIKDGRFVGCGGPLNLDEVISGFLELMEPGAR